MSFSTAPFYDGLQYTTYKIYTFVFKLVTFTEISTIFLEFLDFKSKWTFCQIISMQHEHPDIPVLVIPVEMEVDMDKANIII